MKKFYSGCLFFVCILIVTSCGRVNPQQSSTITSAADSQTPYTKDIFAMDTYMTLTAYGSHGEEAVNAAVEEIQRLEQLMSTAIETSEVAKLNASQGGTISADTEFLIEKSLELYESTSGAFDIAIYPLMEEWGFPSGEYQVPNVATIRELLKLSNMDRIDLNTETHQVTFGLEGMAIDLGGIAKGYTSQRVMEIFAEQGVTSAVVSLGGNVQVLGTKVDGTLWNVAIENPEDTSTYLGVLQIADQAVITSGGYERYFEENGVRYHHILDPATGYPADSGLISVTIVTDDGTLGDGLSTSLFVLGKEKAIAYWQKNWESFDFILETEDHQLIVSEGIAEQFSSDYDITIVEREP